MAFTPGGDLIRILNRTIDQSLFTRGRTNMDSMENQFKKLHKDFNKPNSILKDRQKLSKMTKEEINKVIEERKKALDEIIKTRLILDSTEVSR